MSDANLIHDKRITRGSQQKNALILVKVLATLSLCLFFTRKKNKTRWLTYL